MGTTEAEASPIPKEEVTSGAAADYDRKRELKQFDDTKAGVKGIVDAGVTTIPRFFHFPASLLTFRPATTSPSLSIPIIDLSLPRPRAVQLVTAAAREWGFFQVINHSVPLNHISAVLSAVKAFNELPTEAKAAYYTHDQTRGFAFNTNFDLYKTGAASWKDTVRVVTAPTPPDPAVIPEVCREELLAWDQTARGLAARLMGLLSEGLGVEAGRLQGLSCLEMRAVLGHYYPYCPQPELTLGVVAHTDPTALTVLVQNEVGGLLIKKGSVFDDGEWFEIDPVPGAIIINIGDILQIISNDEYKSAEHKVIANPRQTPRISVVVFCVPGKTDDSTYYGPLPELVSKEKPARYRQFTMSEFRRLMFGRVQGVNSVLCGFKVEEPHSSP
ncbi:hypothetical protein Taro_032485 [Colocasia esculenta]|uniref:Fe2OG dioxygenase domain-containing protein n=1 Tax=Colocasia esculenta TaxID=4460 RepID=A0A843VLG2_COLES|nr:hypothetical protein [Colocasia esculenta]